MFVPPWARPYNSNGNNNNKNNNSKIRVINDNIPVLYRVLSTGVILRENAIPIVKVLKNALWYCIAKHFPAKMH